MEQITITEKDGANYHLYELEGALNAYTLGEFQDTLYDAVQKNNIVLDMSRLIELDASGIGRHALKRSIRRNVRTARIPWRKDRKPRLPCWPLQCRS